MKDLAANTASATQLNEIVTLELQLRVEGKGSEDEEIIRRHADLMPELAEQLKIVTHIAEAFRTDLEATTSDSIDLLSLEELAAPIADDVVLTRPWLEVPGHSIQRQIGSGGQAMVYSAIQQSTGRPVAIKVLRGGDSPDARHLARLERETRIIASLDHPSIVNVIDRGRTSEGSFYLSMPLIEGEHLDEFWRAERAKHAGDIRGILAVFVMLCESLEEAHRRGIVHRDLKPSNILVDRRQMPHVLDFGLARDDLSTPEISIEGQMVGSLPWTSPEQASGLVATPRSDVYALAVMLYEALTGQPPYSTSGPVAQTRTNVLNAIPLAPSKCVKARDRKWGNGIDTVLYRALSKSPNSRQSSAGRFADGLRPFLDNPNRKARRGNTGLLSVAAALVVIVAIVTELIPQPAQTPVQVSSQPLPSFTNSIGIKLILLPPGNCVIGSAPGDPNGGYAGPQKRVAIRSFYLATTEVTEAQWSAVMGDGRSHSSLPHVNVTWDSANEFCAKLGATDHRHYRLPRSDEWEYAAKCGVSDAPFGLAPDGREAKAEEVAWSQSNSGSKLHPVAEKSPSIWGLYDICGNAAEWCSDNAELGAFSAPSHESVKKIIRGGSAWSDPASLRAAAWNAIDPRLAKERVGFRIACDTP